MIGHKPRLNKFQRTKLIQTPFSDHCIIKLQLSNSKISRKVTNSLKLKKNSYVTHKSKKKL